MTTSYILCNYISYISINYALDSTLTYFILCSWLHPCCVIIQWGNAQYMAELIQLCIHKCKLVGCRLSLIIILVLSSCLFLQMMLQGSSCLCQIQLEVTISMPHLLMYVDMQSIFLYRPVNGIGSMAQ